MYRLFLKFWSEFWILTESIFLLRVTSFKMDGGGSQPKTVVGGKPRMYSQEFSGENEMYEESESEREMYDEQDGEEREVVTPLPIEYDAALIPLPSPDPLDSSVSIGALLVTSSEEATELANIVIEVLEEDLEGYFVNHPEARPLYQYTGSDISLKLEWSGTLPDQPSTMRLYYEQGTSEYRDMSLTSLEPEQMVDKECEAHLHRNKYLFGRDGQTSMNVADGFSQTKEMALVSAEFAEKMYRQIYPMSEKSKPLAAPSRKQSLDIVLDAAATEDPSVDQAIVGPKPKVKWSSKQRLLKPLPENYYKVETFWTGSTYSGEYTNRQFNHGFFNYPLMSTYDSEFKQGHIHSKKHLGQITYPRGDTWVGQWRKGRHISGKITFCDDLEYYPRNWEYCIKGDRRFYVEHDVGLKAGGNTLYNNRLPPPVIPPGCYDTGDGIFDPKTKEITTFDGMKLRDATCNEELWIMENCRKIESVEERYIPSFNVDRLPCSSIDNYVRQ